MIYRYTVNIRLFPLVPDCRAQRQAQAARIPSALSGAAAPSRAGPAAGGRTIGSPEDPVGQAAAVVPVVPIARVNEVRPRPTEAVVRMAP